VAKNFPAVLLLGSLRIKAQSVAEATDLVLQTSDDADGQLLFLRTKTVCSTDHAAQLHGLSMPMVTFQAALEVGVALGLEEVVVVTLLGEEVRFVVAAVVADGFGNLANGVFVLVDELPVLLLLAAVDFDETFLFGQSAFEFGNAGG
jgi:hypothetical protein